MRKHPCIRRFATPVARAIQPALPLGHADVDWDALPRAVQVDVLARWCEMLRDVMTPKTDVGMVRDESGS